MSGIQENKGSLKTFLTVCTCWRLQDPASSAVPSFLFRTHHSNTLYIILPHANEGQSISNHRGDLSNVTAPPYVLASKSAVEFPASWAEHPAILCAPAKEQDPEERARLVLKW